MADLAIATNNTMRSAAVAQSTDPLAAFEPQNWTEMIRFADMLSKTDFAPKDFKGKPEACAIAMLYGRQLGVGGLQAIQNIAVINGRPSVYGDLFWAIIISHPEFVDVEEKSDENGAWVKLTRKKRAPKEATFTKKDAQTAGLWGKGGPWTNYPANQMLWRARTFAGRALFADALKGMTSSYEAEDYDGTTIDATPSSPATTTPTSGTPSTPTPAPPAKITQEQAREFGKAWKASGFTMAEAKEALQRICSVGSSLDIPTDKYGEAMKWAKKEDVAKASTEESACREMFGILGYDFEAQAKAIDSTNGDWVALAARLNSELPVTE
jgi:hypothetical protein